MTPPKPRPAVPTLREAEAAGKTSDVDVDQQVATISPMTLFPKSLSLISLTPISLSLRHARIAR